MSGCSQGCANISGSETCYCVPGYQLDMDNVNCSGLNNKPFSFFHDYVKFHSDINECTEDSCDHNCTNTNGSFICSCNNGYELDDNGRSCNGMYIC